MKTVRRNPRAACAIVLGASLAVAGCGTAPAAEAGGATKLRVVIQPYLVSAPLHLAQKEGIFAAYGLDVELVPMAGSEPAIPLLINGSVDVLPGHAAPGLLNAIARGERIRMVAERSRREPGQCSSVGLLARPGLLDEPRSAGGAPRIRRISVDRQAAMLFFIEEALASVGVALDTLQRVYVPHAVEPDALASANIDVALSGEPFLSRTVRAGKAEPWIGVEDVLPGIEFSVLFFGRRLLDDERAAGARFVAAFLEANRRLAGGKTKTNLALVGDFLSESPVALEDVCWPFQPSDGRIRTDYLMRFQRWAHGRGLIDRVATPDELIDPGFLDGASRLVTKSPHTERDIR